MELNNKFFLVTSDSEEILYQNISTGSIINGLSDKSYIITTTKYLFDFDISGTYLREVFIPIDDKIMINIQNTNIKINKLILGNQFDLSKIETFKYLIEQNLDINNSKIINWASKYGHLEIIKFILDNLSWTPNFEYYSYSNITTSISIAAKFNQLQIINYFIDNSIDFDIDCVTKKIIQYKHLDLVKKITEKYNIDVNIIFDHALKYKYFDAIKYIISLENNDEEKNIKINKACLKFNLSDGKIFQQTGDVLFMVTNRNEIHEGVPMGTGLNIFSKLSLISTTVKHIHKYFAGGYYLRIVTRPLDNPKFISLEMSGIYRTNMLILGQRFVLSDPNTFILLGDLGFDLGNQSPMTWACNFTKSIVSGTNYKQLNKQYNKQYSNRKQYSNYKNISPVDHQSLFTRDIYGFDFEEPKDVHPNKTISKTASKTLEKDKTEIKIIETPQNIIEKHIVNESLHYVKSMIADDPELFETALYCAAKIGQIDILEYLVSQRKLSVDIINKAMQSAFTYSDHYNNQYRVYKILKNYDLDLDSVINTAAGCGNIDIVKDITSQGRDPRKAFFIAVECGHFKIIKHIGKLKRLTINDIKMAITTVKGQIHDILFFTEETDVFQQETIIDLLEQIMLFAI
ncbi:putative ankyrin repeat protein [Powai lake megavirus]|uniref:Putative ankyrin repeat protein n=1 Tax=Powai lake megavirus TaxID=1842663 RepID=A0A167RPX9_9VIRU|nr:putative ankyrin repeat protein [Powai lake megavirus]ANB50984.1 putative ankyrin repeat protein [Powai lake megavirus]